MTSTNSYVGKQIGNYRITTKLGQGGFAEVYLGEHIYLKTPAAIKLLLTKVATQKDRDAFLKEAQTIARLIHPNIVRTLDFGTDGETPFLVMDYAPNGTLRQRHPKGMLLPLSDIVSYVKQVADALQYAHDQKLIHRDIKPENMLLGRSNEILLSDFGIALVAQSTGHQSTQNVAGTAAYMSPEQIQGKPRLASDQYSLGIVIYEWVSGERPFRGSFAELCAQHMSAPLPPLREKVPILRPEVEEVILKALAKNPEQRFFNVEAFALALKRASQLPITPSLYTVSPILSLRDRVASPPPVIKEIVFSEGISQELSLNTPHNDQSRNLRPPSGSFERLWREAVQAQARGDREQAFRLLRTITTMQGFAPSQIESVKTQIRSLRQMIPLCLQQAREVVSQGRWQDEIQAWEDLLALEPSAQEITTQLTLHPKGSMEGDIQERLRIAQHNEQCAWMYTQAQQFIREQDDTAARAQLEILWKNAPTYGDPASLAQVVGLPPASNYEQALAEEQTRQQQEMKKAERMHQRREREEQTRQQQEMEKAERMRQKQKNREITLEAGAGGGVGAAAGALLTIIVASRVAKTAIAFPVVSAIENFLSAVTQLAGFTELIWGAILGALVGLVIGGFVGTKFFAGGEGLGGGTVVGAAMLAATGALAGASIPGGGAGGIITAILVLLGCGITGGWADGKVGCIIGVIIGLAMLGALAGASIPGGGAGGIITAILVLLGCGITGGWADGKVGCIIGATIGIFYKRPTI